MDDLLTPLDASGAGLPAIPVGSTDWYRWLNEPATRSFAFSSPKGTFTARNERLRPASVPDLHRRASQWYEQHGLFVEAVTHALAVPDMEHSARLIEERGMMLAQRGQAHRVLQWLNTLPDALVRTRPYLCIIHALVLMLTHQIEASEARLREAERCVQAGRATEPVQTILGWVAAIRATFDIFSDDVARNVALSLQALDLLPEMEGSGGQGPSSARPAPSW